MSEAIRIELHPSGCVGSRAIVTTSRWFRRPQVAEFICHHVGVMMGAEWVDAATGAAASESLALRINNAAQAAGRLHRVAPLCTTRA